MLLMSLLFRVGVGLPFPGGHEGHITIVQIRKECCDASMI